MSRAKLWAEPALQHILGWKALLKGQLWGPQSLEKYVINPKIMQFCVLSPGVQRDCDSFGFGCQRKAILLYFYLSQTIGFQNSAKKSDIANFLLT